MIRISFNQRIFFFVGYDGKLNQMDIYFVELYFYFVYMILQNAHLKNLLFAMISMRRRFNILKIFSDIKNEILISIIRILDISYSNS